MGVYFAHTGVDVSCVLRRFGICSLERVVVLVVFVLRSSFGMTPRLVASHIVAVLRPARPTPFRLALSHFSIPFVGRHVRWHLFVAAMSAPAQCRFLGRRLSVVQFGFLTRKK